MKIPDLYHNACEMQRRDTSCVLNWYSDKINWRHDGCDSLIDIGSGTGDVLMDFVYTLMPRNFQRIVCSDLNPDMVSYAQRRYGHIEKTEFKILDIAADTDLPSDLSGQFDHVTSFYVMMWFQNQRRALQNIFKLLRCAGGDCLMTFLASYPTYDAYKLCSKMPKWSKYMEDVDRITAPLQYSRDPAKEYGELMSEAGFSDQTVEVLQAVYVYENVDDFKANMTAVNPFLHRIPHTLQSDFMNDVITMTLMSLNFKANINTGSSGVLIPYKLMVVYGKKSAAGRI